jgi:hypothetical protein
MLNKSQLQSALESLLENESLTADLDDAAAKVLLDWGMAYVRLSHRLAVDSPEPEGYIHNQMRTTRKWMRAVNRWSASRAEKDDAGNLAALENILTLTGADIDPEQQIEFLRENLFTPTPEFIDRLRTFCEKGQKSTKD